jgi:hypothetical protein
MRSDARDAIKGWQIGREAAQVASRVSAMTAGDRAGLKKDLLFCRSRDTGTQDWKVLSLRLMGGCSILV